jgi:RNA polymerase sigma-70 factor (ECF subfamily)
MRREAFDEAVERHQRRVYTLASYLLGDSSDAEDVTQEVLIRLWKRGHEVDPNRLGPWLLRVTRNACIDLQRRRGSGPGVVSLVGDGGTDLDPSETAPGPEVLARASELGTRIRQGLGSLSEPFRSVVILREIQGLTYQEIAEALEIPLSSVRASLHRGRRRLRDQLREVRDHVAAC